MDFYRSIYYKQLKHDLIMKSGVAMNNFSDSKLLSAAMESAKFSVSPHTLARFFGFMPTRKIYPFTLQILCNYLGFEHFEDYRAFVEQKHSRNLIGSNGLFENELFSFESFELAVEQMDIGYIQEHIDCINVSNNKIEYLAHLTGFLVRDSTQQSQLLEILAKSTNGRSLFYERFVDEDNPNEYFSTAIETYYLKYATNMNNKIFGYCFLIAKRIYANKAVGHLMNTFENFKLLDNLSELHFHEISRLIECQILIDGLDGKIRKTYINYIDKLLSFEQLFDHTSYEWILARSIKALAFNRMLKKSLESVSFSEAIFRCYRKSTVDTVAALILQFVVHSIYKNKDDFPLNPPLRLPTFSNENENNGRVLLESSTSFIYAEGKEKDVLKKNILTFSKQTHQTWVLEMIQ